MPLREQLNWLSAQRDDWLKQAIQHLTVDKLGTSPNEDLSDLMHRVHLLRHVSLFQGMTSKDLSVIAPRLHKLSVQKGALIIQEGDMGDSLMIMDGGRAGVYRSGQLLGELKRGDCFGEMAILTQGARTATIRAEEDVLLWRLDSSVFYDMMFDQTSIAVEMMKLLSRRLRSELERGQTANKSELEQSHAEVAATMQLPATKTAEGLTKDEVILRRILVLQKVDLFVHLAPEDFIWLAQRVEEVAYEHGEVICRAGDFGDTMYGIIEGSILVHRGSEEYAILEEGAFFGEMAIIDSGPRSADCTAKEAAVLLQLHRDLVLTFCFQNIDVLRSMMRVIADRLRGMS